MKTLITTLMLVPTLAFAQQQYAPVEVSRAQIMLDLLRCATAVHLRPVSALELLNRALRDARAVRAMRGEAAEAAAGVLALTAGSGSSSGDAIASHERDDADEDGPRTRDDGKWPAPLRALHEDRSRDFPPGWRA